MNLQWFRIISYFAEVCHKLMTLLLFIQAIDPFPIIGFYLYHVLSADQSNNWTTSGIWSCNNLLQFCMHFTYIHNGLNTKQKENGNYMYHNYIWWQKKVNFISNLSNLRWTKPCKLLFKWYAYWHIFPQLFPLLLTKALMRWCVSLRVYTKILQKSMRLNAHFSEKLCLYIAIYANFFKRENEWIV